MRVFHFTHAIVRRPAASVVHGLRAVDRGPPDPEELHREHRDYVAALQAAGVEVTVLPAVEAWPDSVFVEDPALVFHNGAISLRPGTASRRGEADELAPELERRFPRLIAMPGPGCAEGGDVLVTSETVMIGLSKRTSEAGAEALGACLARLGLRSEAVRTPPQVLHLKSDCSMLDDNTVFCTRRLAESGIFEGMRVVLVPDGEEPAANALRVNDRVLVSRQYPRAIQRLSKHGFLVHPLKTEQIAKLDAGLSCMSLRWWDRNA